MSDIVLIGAGKLGTNLVYALLQKGHRIAAISDKNLSSAQESREFIGQGKVIDNNQSAAQHGSWIILTVPDDMIDTVAEELSDSNLDWKGKFVFHCSGLLSTESLKGLERKGAFVASIHPVQSFPQKKPDPNAFVDIFFGIEGKGEALELAKKITRQLDAKYFILEAKNKALYHTACSMASNFMATILDTALELLQQTGLSKSRASKLLFPLVQGTLQNVKKIDAGKALTGPVVRGDIESIKKHLNALSKMPELRNLYVQLAFQSLEIAKRENKLSPEEIRAFRALLEGK
jgi:predicted short-subunit dehydrogenase-like oxidoreductase (DUF2520 family)